ncbi:MAG: ATP-grasp domain-containing protein [Deltaproteobacteria bacterium]|nr:ATP-grasp domain-containing protein [Deltaproteobacteria bacterium]
MRVAVVFNTPHADWNPERHEAQMLSEFAKEKHAEPEMEYQIGRALQKLGHDVLLLGVYDDLRDMSKRLADWKPALVFNATEAFLANSELDYLIPALLEAEGYRYTGAPPLALLVTRNKSMSKKILAYHGVNVPGFASYRVGERPTDKVTLRFPLIVKPLSTDASEGIAQASIVHDVSSLVDRVAFVHDRFAQAAIAEEYIEGRELYATIIGNGDSVEILPIVEMTFDTAGSRPEDRIATRSAKWDLGYRERRGIKNVFARRMAKATKDRLQEISLISYRAFWLRDYARIDVRLAADGQIWFIEANANPFLSEGHDSAESARKAGMNYPAFIQRIVDLAMSREP